LKAWVTNVGRTRRPASRNGSTATTAMGLVGGVVAVGCIVAVGDGITVGVAVGGGVGVGSVSTKGRKVSVAVTTTGGRGLGAVVGVVAACSLVAGASCSGAQAVSHKVRRITRQRDRLIGRL
jgi:hypothetical protein